MRRRPEDGMANGSSSSPSSSYGGYGYSAGAAPSYGGGAYYGSGAPQPPPRQQVRAWVR